MRPDGDSVDGILVVEWSGREVEVVSIDGRLDGLLDAMIEEAARDGGRASGPSIRSSRDRCVRMER